MGPVTQARHLPFNSPVETGLKALVVLVEAHPSSYSLEKMVIFDYLLVHSADIDEETTSLHPPTPMRSGELVVRRELVESGLRLYASRGLVRVRYSSSGFEYEATEDAAPFLQSLVSSYTEGLKRAAVWLVELLGDTPDEALRQTVNRKLGDWGTEFLVDCAQTEPV